MSAYLFDRYSTTCPVCDRTRTLATAPSFEGLYICPNCQARLVVCHSGHYVRDPLSRPASRHRGICGHNRSVAQFLRGTIRTERACLLAVLTAAVVLTVSSVFSEGWRGPRSPFSSPPEAADTEFSAD